MVTSVVTYDAIVRKQKSIEDALLLYWIVISHLLFGKYNHLLLGMGNENCAEWI